MNNINNLVENSQSLNSKNKITEENKKLKFPKKLIGEKIQINSIQKENKKENKTFENIFVHIRNFCYKNFLNRLLKICVIPDFGLTL